MNGECSRGQYMVEFALAFAVFVVFVLFVIDIGLMIYNHNLFYRAVVESARTASLGRSNDEIRETLWEQINGRYFPTLLMIATPQQDPALREDHPNRRD